MEGKMGNLVSIIVPVYNGEKYLERCFMSLVNQTYHDIEVIIIDDGSTDSSYDICNFYAKKFSNITVIKKENGGVSSARNIGLINAKGDFITFVDSDDYVDCMFIQNLMTAQKLYNADLLISNAIDVYENGDIVPAKNINKILFLNQEEAIFHFLKSDYYTPVCWGRLYRKSCIKSLKFDEKLRIAEDGKFFLSAIENSEQIYVIPDTKYYYYIRNGSTVHSGFTEIYYDEIEFCEELVERYKYSEKLSITANYKLFNFLSRLLIITDFPYRDYLIIKEKYKGLYYKMRTDISFKHKIKYHILQSTLLRNIYVRIKNHDKINNHK